MAGYTCGLSKAQAEPLFEDEPAGASASAGGGYVRVALERSIDLADGGLTYALTEALSATGVGDRVEVPLGRGNRPARGIVVQRYPAETELSELGLAEDTRVKAVLRRLGADSGVSDAGESAGSGDGGAAGLPADLVELARWIAGYYCCPLGMVFGSMLPAAVKHGTGTRRRWEVRATGSAAAEQEPSLTKLQRAVLEAAAEPGQVGRWIEADALARRAGAKSQAPVKALVDRGLLASRRRAVVVSDLDLRAQRTRVQPPPALTPAQSSAVQRLGGALGQGFSVHLLHGVTGSGKTEVYLRTIEALRERGAAEREGGEPPAKGAGSGKAGGGGVGGVMVLVPEIALTPQTVGRFLARFGEGLADDTQGGDVEGGGGGGAGGGVAVLHSGLTAAQRHAQWQRIRQGRARIVIGARSAVFAPLPRLDLIIVDEEHESSYKQDQLPRYHARDVAIKRGQMAGCPVLLGSATPSLESYHHAVTPVKSATSGEPPATRYGLIQLPDRVPGAQLPAVQIVDLARERRERRGVHLLSARLESALRSNLDLGGQAMLLLNRRGYANYLACPDHRCGWMMRCEHCDVTMVYHRAMSGSPGSRSEHRKQGASQWGGKGGGGGGVTRCHHCQAEQALVTVCPESGHKVSVFGLGTQRVEEELARKFADARLARMDADVMRNAGDYRRTLERFSAGEIDILLGTQMIAKGLDVANVRLVGVVSGDTSLNFPDFRASERTFQLIAQVAGRAGRGRQRGQVIVQSFNPDDPAIRAAAEHDYVGFAQRELSIRGEAGLPPIGRMARIVLRDTDHLANTRRAHALATALRRASAELAGGAGGPGGGDSGSAGVRVRGPAVCPIARIADFHRQQIELHVAPPAGAADLQRLLTSVRNAGLLVSDTHTAVDVDPVALL